jgi:glycolate oxidase iron-sulfur subunit
VLWGEEMDSPRGRIYLMKAGLEGRAGMTSSFVQHFDRCLGCLACVTACPSGVQYAPLIEKSRVQIERHYQRPEDERLFRRLLMAIIPYPSRLRVLMAPLLALSPFMGRNGGIKPSLARLFPAQLQALLAVAPRVSLAGLLGRMRQRTQAVGAERLKVALLEGCVQRVAFAGVNEATARVLAAEGCAGLLRRVAAPCRSYRSGSRTGASQHRGVREGGCRPHRDERRRLWVGDEGLRGAV